MRNKRTTNTYCRNKAKNNVVLNRAYENIHAKYIKHKTDTLTGIVYRDRNRMRLLETPQERKVVDAIKRCIYIQQT